MTDTVNIYRKNNEQVIIGLKIANYDYKPERAIQSINDDLSEEGIDANNILGTDAVDISIYTEDNMPEDFTRVLDRLGRQINLYNWKTKESSETDIRTGFPFRESYNYNLGDKMFYITLDTSLEIIVNSKIIYDYKPVLLVKDNS